MKRETVRIKAPGKKPTSAPEGAPAGPGAAPKKESTKIEAEGVTPPPPKPPSKPFVPPAPPKPAAAPAAKPQAAAAAPQKAAAAPPVTVRAASPKKETARIQIPPSPKQMPKATIKMQETKPLASMPAAQVTTTQVAQQAPAGAEGDSLAMPLAVTAVVVSAIVVALELWTYLS